MKKILIIITVLGLITSSCSDFLDEDPKGIITTQNYYQTEQHAIAATDAIYDYLIGGYAPMGLWDNNFGGTYFNSYWVLQDLFSDNANSQIQSPEYQSIDKFSIDQYNLNAELLWRDFYQTIKACNIVLDKVPNTSMTNPALKAHLQAEAHFIRALMYFDLVRMYGDVPLHTKDVETDEEENIPRSPREDVYKVIIEDLKVAEADLKYTTRMGGGRPYAESATALLARVYLTYGALHKDKAYFALAAEKAEEVIPKFPMMTSYSDLWKIQNRFNSEIIYGINFSGTLSEGWKSIQYLVRLLPTVKDGTKNVPGSPDNAQGWETATEDLYSAFGNIGDERMDVTLRKIFVDDNNVSHSLPHPYIFKFWDRVAEPKGNSTDAIFPLIRTAEMYLIKAEALNEINEGANQAAIDAVNQVRSRAGIKDKKTLPTDYAGFKKAVLEEYRLEFVMEGRRWFDLTRMCAEAEFIARIKAAKPDATPSKTHFLFPIPAKDRTLSNNVLTQNEGYN